MPRSTITLKLRIGTFSWDSLLANGLGQGPALNLRLISTDGPASFSLGDAATAPAPATPSNSSGPAAGPLPETFAFTSSTPIAVAHGFISSPSSSSFGSHGSPGLAIDLGGVLVGRPSLDADRIAAVGPGTSPGAIAMASAGPGLGQALAAMGSLRGSFSLGQDGPPQQPETSPITDGSMPPTTAPITDGSMPPEAPPELAVQAPIAPDVDVAPMIPASKAELPAMMATEGATLAPTAAASTSEAAEAPAGITAWVVGLAGAAALGARWYQKRQRQAARPATVVRVIPAPHLARAGVRV